LYRVILIVSPFFEGKFEKTESLDHGYISRNTFLYQTDLEKMIITTLGKGIWLLPLTFSLSRESQIPFPTKSQKCSQNSIENIHKRD